MKTEQAIIAVTENLATASTALDRLAVAAASGRKLDRPQVNVLLNALRLANCAALELDARATGTPEPKRGD